MMEGPKRIWIGADWKAERDHYGLDHRCGRFSTERFYEDDKGYVPADLTDVLVEAAKEALELLQTTPACFGLGVCRHYTECICPDGECRIVYNIKAVLPKEDR